MKFVRYSKRITKTLLWVFSAVVFERALASEICQEFYETVLIEIKSFDKDFRELSVKSPGAPNGVFAPILNQALYPLVHGFHRELQNMKSEQIVNRLKELESAHAIKKSLYKKGYDNVAAAPGVLDLVDHNSKNAIDTYKLDTDEGLGKHKRFLYLDSSINSLELGNFFPLLNAFLTPVGAYGEEFSVDLLRTTQIMTQIIGEKMKEASATTFRLNEVLLRTKTTRAQNIDLEQVRPELTPMNMLTEGVVSFNQLLGLLLAEKIVGLEDGPSALRALVRSGETSIGLASEITGRLPMAIVGPATNAGFFVHKALELNSDGKLVPSPQLKDRFTSWKKIFEGRFYKKGICPMALLFREDSKTNISVKPPARNSGIQLIAEDFLRLFEEVHKARIEGLSLESKQPEVIPLLPPAATHKKSFWQAILKNISRNVN